MNNFFITAFIFIFGLNLVIARQPKIGFDHGHVFGYPRFNRNFGHRGSDYQNPLPSRWDWNPWHYGNNGKKCDQAMLYIDQIITNYNHEKMKFLGGPNPISVMLEKLKRYVMQTSRQDFCRTFLSTGGPLQVEAQFINVNYFQLSHQYPYS